MATKKVYAASSGPYLYVDSDLVNDPDGDFSEAYRNAVMTDGQLWVGESPSDDHHVMRLMDAGYWRQFMVGVR